MKKYFYSLLTMLTAVFALSSCEDVPAPYDIPEAGGSGNTGIAPAGTGTLDDPFNVEGVLAFIEAGENLDSKVYIKGYVTSIKECSPSFGNATFYIASEPGGTNTFYVYRCNGIDNGKITSEDQIKEGDEVIVYGKVTDYNGTKETVQKEAYIYSINGEGGNGGGNQGSSVEPKGTGSEVDPFNVAAAIAKCKETGTTPTNDVYYVKGIVKSVNETGISQYGNINVDMVDEAGSSDVFQAFQIVSFGGAKFTQSGVVKEGDVIVVKGKLVNYMNNTPETEGKGAAQLVSVNGQGGGNTTPEVTPGTPSGNGTIDTPFNVAAAVKKCKEVGDAASADSYYVTGIVSKLDTKYANTFFISDDGTTNNQLEFYNGVGIDGATLQNGDVNVGDKVVVYGQLQNYKGNTPELIKGCKIISLTKGTNSGNTGGGNDNPGTSLSSLINGGFEEWDGTTPTGWKSASTASSATLKQSTDAHGGNYSVSVEGATSNKRLASSEITLAAGTYTFSFYAKATKSDKCQCRPGYVPVIDGTVGSYAYGDYVTIKTGDWTKVSTTFTLDKETVVCLVVMNPKGGTEYMDQQAILIDDATLTK